MTPSWWRHQMETFSALLGPVNSPHKGQWRGALMFSLICVWINGYVNNRKAGDLRRYRVHYDVSVMGSLLRYCFIVIWSAVNYHFDSFQQFSDDKVVSMRNILLLLLQIYFVGSILSFRSVFLSAKPSDETTEPLHRNRLHYHSQHDVR